MGGASAWTASRVGRLRLAALPKARRAGGERIGFSSGGCESAVGILRERHAPGSRGNARWRMDAGGANESRRGAAELDRGGSFCGVRGEGEGNVDRGEGRRLCDVIGGHHGSGAGGNTEGSGDDDRGEWRRGLSRGGMKLTLLLALTASAIAQPAQRVVLFDELVRIPRSQWRGLTPVVLRQRPAIVEVDYTVVSGGAEVRAVVMTRQEVARFRDGHSPRAVAATQPSREGKLRHLIT